MYSYDRPWKPYRRTPGVGELRGQREHLRDRRIRPVRGGVEAGDLRHVRQALEQRANRRQVVRLVQRCKRHELVQLRDDGSVQSHGRRKVGPAVHHAMADRGHTIARAVLRLQPVEDVRERAVVSQLRACSHFFSLAVLPRCVLGHEGRRGVNPFDLPRPTSASSVRARRTART
jgi:hypothetical protein